MKPEGQQYRYGSYVGDPSASSCVRVLLVHGCQPCICIQRREGDGRTSLLFKDTFRETGSSISAWIPGPRRVVMSTCSKILEMCVLYWVLICRAKCRISVTVTEKRAEWLMENTSWLLPLVSSDILL